MQTLYHLDAVSDGTNMLRRGVYVRVHVCVCVVYLAGEAMQAIKSAH